jgi:hypothetical protein
MATASDFSVSSSQFINRLSTVESIPKLFFPLSAKKTFVCSECAASLTYWPHIAWWGLQITAFLVTSFLQRSVPWSLHSNKQHAERASTSLDSSRKCKWNWTCALSKVAHFWLREVWYVGNMCNKHTSSIQHKLCLVKCNNLLQVSTPSDHL